MSNEAGNLNESINPNPVHVFSLDSNLGISDNRPCIDVIIASQKVSALLDTGATASVCNSFGADYLESLGYKKQSS